MRMALALLLLAFPLLAQDDPFPELIPAAEEEKKPPELHKIYVPYDKLDQVLGSGKERVMVPYKEFLELWQLKYGPKRDGTKPPIPFTVESARYEGRVVDGIAVFDATLTVELFDDRWQRIPLAFSSVAFEEVRVDDEPGVLVPTKRGYELILRGQGRHTITTRFVAGVARGKEYNATSFGLPSVPLHRLSFRVDGKDTEMRIEPARAHSTTTEGDATVLLAFLGPQGKVKISWRAKPEERDVEPSLVFATDLVDVKVEERVVRGTAQFDLEVLRTPLAQFEVRIPDGVSVLEVNGKNIRTWGFADEARRRLQIALRKPVLGRDSVKIGFEGPVTVPGDLRAPVFRIEGAARERGWLRVQGAEGVGVRPNNLENIFQIDLATLPAPIRGGRQALGFRFPAVPYALDLRTERIEPRVTLLTRARLIVERRQVKLHTDFHFTVERAGIFTLALEVPDGIVLTDIGNSKLVDSWRETKEGDQRVLSLALRGRKLGKFTLPIRAVRTLDLNTPALPVPLIKVRGVQREEGTLSVFMDPGIDASAKTSGVVPVEIAKLQREDPYGATVPLRFGYRWRGRDPKVDFEVKARKPKVSCVVRNALQAEENKVRFATDLAFSIQYTGIEQVRVRVPKRIAENVKLEQTYEVKKVDDAVEAGREPTQTWTIELGGPVLGDLLLRFRYDEKFDSLKVNEKRNVPVAPVTPLDMHTTTSFVAVRKAPVLKIDTPTSDYEQIDPTELPAALRTEDVFLALRRLDEPAAFPLAIEKHAYQPVADLVVRHAHLKTVIPAEGDATTTAYLELLNNDRQFLALKLPEGSRVLELWVANDVKKPRLGDGGVILAELKTGLAKDAAFRVAVVYTHPIDRRGGLGSEVRLEGIDLPAYEDRGAPFQALLTWSVVYPGTWEVTGIDGNVVPARESRSDRSWVSRAVQALGGLVRPASGIGLSRPAKGRAMPAYEDIVPVHVERDARELLLTNGTGDGRAIVHYRTPAAQTSAIVFAVLAGIALVFGLARQFRPLVVGGVIAIGTLVLLAFSSYGWVPVFNGLLGGALVTTVVLWVLEKRGAKA
ncbi:MAG: hypothetical protein AAGD14_03490 [Planctomycetota bacterium]